MGQNVGPQIQHHVRHCVGDGGSSKFVGWKYPHPQIGEVSNRIYGNTENRDYLAWLPMYITEDHGQMEEVSSLKSKMGIATSDFEAMVIVNR